MLHISFSSFASFLSKKTEMYRTIIRLCYILIRVTEVFIRNYVLNQFYFHMKSQYLSIKKKFCLLIID